MMRAYILPLLILLGACSPQAQEYVANAQHKPELVEDEFHAADAAILPYRSWIPETKTTAAIVALHGFNDYSRAFEESGLFFQEHGVAV